MSFYRATLCLVLLVGLPHAGAAQLPEATMKEAVRGMEADLGLKATIERLRKGEIPPDKLAMIDLILENTHELAIHQQLGGSENRTLVHDGHEEAVVDAAGKAVEDGVNDASYNYYHPEKDALRHFAFDLVPWVLWGNTPHDTTTPKERISAYLADLGAGIRAALKQRGRLAELKGTRWADDGQLQALAIFVRAAEAGKADADFPLFDGATEVPDARLLAALEKLQKGFVIVFGT